METRVPFSWIESKDTGIHIERVEFDEELFKRTTKYYHTLKRGLNKEETPVQAKLLEIEMDNIRVFREIASKFPRGLRIKCSNWVIVDKDSYSKWDTCCTMLISVIGTDFMASPIWLRGDDQFNC